MTVLAVAEAVVIVLLGILLIGLMRSNAAIRRRLHAMDPPPEAATPASITAHDIAGVGLDGSIVGIRVPEDDRATLLAFMTTTCSGCKHFWERFATPEAVATLGDIRLIIIAHGADLENPTELAAVAPAGIPLVMSSIAWASYQAPGSPHFVMIDGASGAITARGHAPDWDAMLELVGLAD